MRLSRRQACGVILSTVFAGSMPGATEARADHARTEKDPLDGQTIAEILTTEHVEPIPELADLTLPAGAGPRVIELTVENYDAEFRGLRDTANGACVIFYSDTDPSCRRRIDLIRGCIAYASAPFATPTFLVDIDKLHSMGTEQRHPLIRLWTMVGRVQPVPAMAFIENSGEISAGRVNIPYVRGQKLATLKPLGALGEAAPALR